jgi:hypothetical protein
MRIQIEVPEDDAKALKELMSELGMDTYKDLFSNAISLLDWTARETRDGYTIASVDAKHETMKELVMPALARLARKRESVPAR